MVRNEYALRKGRLKLEKSDLLRALLGFSDAQTSDSYLSVSFF